MIEVMDQGIGRIMHQLDTLGLRQNTIVVFTSDNGPHIEWERTRRYDPTI